MDKYQSEVFGEFTYSESMTYEDLLACENSLLANLEEIFGDAGAEHLDFTPLGDILMAQCAFTAKNLEILRDVAQEIAAVLPDGVRGRLLCLQKDLSSYHSFWIERGKWREREYALPKKAPADAPLNEVPLLEPETAEEDVSEEQSGE